MRHLPTPSAIGCQRGAFRFFGHAWKNDELRGKGYGRLENIYEAYLSDGVNRLFTLLIATERKSMDGELATAAKQTSISRFAGVALLRKYKEHVEHFHDAVDTSTLCFKKEHSPAFEPP